MYLKFTVSIFLLFTSFLVLSCGLISALKVNKLLEKGRIEQISFKKEISFKDDDGRIVIPVDIQGSSYDFLFDSGAITVIDESLAEKIEYKKIAKKSVIDQADFRKSLRYIELEEVAVSQVKFYNIGAVISDLSVLNEHACMNVHGIIGANVMRNAIWKIDYKQKKIIFSDNINAFSDLFNFDTIPFSVDRQGTPKLTLRLEDNVDQQVIFDTGSNQLLTLPYKNNLQLFAKSKKLKGYGIRYTALGTSLDTSFYINSPSIFLEKHLITSTLISMRNRLSYGIIGCSFLKEYIAVIDWKYQYMYLKKYTHPERYKISFYGFKPSFENGKIIVSYIYEDVYGRANGLALGDHIIAINGKNVEQPSQEDFCTLYNLVVGNNPDKELNLTILRLGKQQEIQLFSQDYSESLNDKD